MRLQVATLCLAFVATVTGCHQSQPQQQFTELPAPAPAQSVSQFATAAASAFADRDIGNVIADWPRTQLMSEDIRYLEHVLIPTVEDSAMDGFRYRLLVDSGSSLFWVHRSGGIAGVSEYYGPATIDSGVLLPLTDS